MTYEHWTGPDGDTLISMDKPRADVIAMELAAGHHKCCTIEAKNWTEANTKYHAHMGWEPYVPMDNDHEHEWKLRPLTRLADGTLERPTGLVHCDCGATKLFDFKDYL